MANLHLFFASLFWHYFCPSKRCLLDHVLDWILICSSYKTMLTYMCRKVDNWVSVSRLSVLQVCRNIDWFYLPGLGCRYNQWQKLSVMMTLVFCHGHNRQARSLLIWLINLPLWKMYRPKPHIWLFRFAGPPCRGVWRQRMDVCHWECE